MEREEDLEKLIMDLITRLEQDEQACNKSLTPIIWFNGLVDYIREQVSTRIEINRVSGQRCISVTNDENKIVDILVKWWVKKYPMSEGQRNQHAYVLAMAFNDFGIYKDLYMYKICQSNSTMRTQDQCYTRWGLSQSRYTVYVYLIDVSQRLYAV